MKMVTEHLKFADVFPEKAAEVAQRLHIKKDEIPFVRKYYTAEKDKTEVKKKERAVISYISTGIKDRDGEKLVPEGAVIENYKKNPVVPFAHDYRTIPPAKNMWIKRDEKGLIAKTVFAKNQRADELYRAYTEDVGGTGPLLSAWSVGFIPIDWEDTEAKALEKDPNLPKRTYNKWEMLEYSAVPIPSCPEALTIAVEKGLISEGLQKELEIEVVKDVEDKEIEVELVGELDHGIKRESEVMLGKRSGAKVNVAWEKEFEIEKDIVTKPETTDEYHHIPVNTTCKITATITISADKGIKATYCGKVKKIHTYLFDVKKWTMEEAKAWVKDHKGVLERYERMIGKDSTMANLKRLEAQGIFKNEKTIGDITEEALTEEKQEKYKCECIKCGHKLTSDKHCKDIKCPECGGTMRRQERPGPGQDGGSGSPGAVASDVEAEEIKAEISEFEEAVNHIRDTYEKLLSEKDEHIADLKAGRVLSRKNRNIVKDAITALNAVLKADAAGEREDTEEDGDGTVTERRYPRRPDEIIRDVEEIEIELEKDGNTKTFTAEDIGIVVEKVLGEKAQDIILKAFEKNSDPEIIRQRIREATQLEVDRIKGKVR